MIVVFWWILRVFAFQLLERRSCRIRQSTFVPVTTKFMANTPLHMSWNVSSSSSNQRFWMLKRNSEQSDIFICSSYAVMPFGLRYHSWYHIDWSSSVLKISCLIEAGISGGHTRQFRSWVVTEKFFDGNALGHYVLLMSFLHFTCRPEMNDCYLSSVRPKL